MSNVLAYQAVSNIEQVLLELPAEQTLCLFRQKVSAYWQESPEHVVLAILVASVSGCQRIAVACDEGVAIDSELDFDCAAAALSAVEIDFNQPFKLLPEYIAKPWGQEIWYTGVEARGVCRFEQGRGSVPIPWLLALFPSQFNAEELVLLKILDPLASPIFGDLYFELHQKKQEVYVVTRVDPVAWPAGVGGIKLGFKPESIQHCDNDEAFKASFAAAVKDYRGIRLEIDAFVDAIRLREGVALNAPVSADILSAWLSEVPAHLVDQELRLREAMNACIAIKPIGLGDVIKIPCYVPHALQHGVRTVEFQTPVYERLIVSFAQKVLTQTHWDTEEAIDLMDLSPDADAEFEPYDFLNGVSGEKIVDFDDFFVVRAQMLPSEVVSVASEGRYLIVMPAKGEVCVNGQVLQAEEAALTTTTSGVITIKSLNQEVSVLICYPKPRC